MDRTPKQKMLAGELYHPDDPEIQADASACKAWMVRYNAALGLSPGDRRALLRERFAAVGDDPLEVPGALVASHGPFTWGATASESLKHAIICEAVAQMALHTLALNPAAAAPPHLLARHFTRKHGRGPLPEPNDALEGNRWVFASKSRS